MIGPSHLATSTEQGAMQGYLKKIIRDAFSMRSVLDGAGMQSPAQRPAALSTDVFERRA